MKYELWLDKVIPEEPVEHKSCGNICQSVYIEVMVRVRRVVLRDQGNEPPLYHFWLVWGRISQPL